MADTNPTAPAPNDDVVIADPVEMAIIEIASVAQRFDNYGEFRAELIGMSSGLIALNKSKQAARDAKPADSTKAAAKG